MRSSVLTYLAALLLFGSNGIVASAIALPSSLIVLLRTALGTAALVSVLGLTRHGNLAITRYPREACALTLSGAALGASWIFLFCAYQLIGVGISSLLYYCGPIIVMALSPVLFGERVSAGKFCGFIVVAAGALLIATQGLGESLPIKGLLCGAASAVCYALMVVASKRAPHIAGVENSTVQVASSFVTALVLTGVTQGHVLFNAETLAAFAHVNWAAVICLGVVNTGIGCLLYFSSVAKLPVQSVAVLGYIEPLSAVVFSVAILGEPVTVARLVGAALIIGGAIFCEVVDRRRVASAALTQVQS